jgi:pimeloyl-ACP methyl ester carboxylesterase
MAEKIDLSVFNTTQSAADINALRQALGHPQLDLYGISYGTRLALTIMRDHPEGVHAAIIDSVYPWGVDLPAEQSANANRAFDIFFATCKTDPTCNAVYPDLRAMFSRVVTRLNKNPLKMSRVTITGDDFAGLAFQMLYDMKAIEYLPAFIFATDRGYHTSIVDFEKRHGVRLA